MMLKKWIAGILAVLIAASVTLVLFTSGEDDEWLNHYDCILLSLVRKS